MLEKQLASIDLKELAGQMITGATILVGTVVGAVSATISVLGTALFSLVIALYILIDKENLFPPDQKAALCLCEAAGGGPDLPCGAP